MSEVYETIKRGLEDAVNGRVTEHMVEYAPVVHGEWIEAYGMEEAMKGTVICSNCRESYSAIVLTNGEITLKNQKTKYCPNCGAKMDGKVKNDD